MVTAEAVYNEISSLLPSTYMEEINELDTINKAIIQKVYNGALSPSNDLLKIHALLDYMYEMINIGNFTEVKPFIRKAITIASYLGLLVLFKQPKTIVLKEQFQIIDHGLLFGCPLDSEPKLLQKCAQVLNKASHLFQSTETLQMSNAENNDSLCENPNTINVNNNNDNMITIERVSCPSMEYFYNNHILKEKPVILDNCINHWPALTKWNDQNYLLKLAGLRTVPVELGVKYTDSEWTQKLMTLEEFIKNHIYNTNNKIGYLAQHQLFQQIPELMDDIFVPEYCCFSDTNEVVDINAWYGPKGTISPTHYDPKKNLLAQVVGEKSIYLFSPSDSEFLYPHNEELLNNTARVDPRELDLDRFPDYIKAKPYFCVLKPGQLLYIPPKWWHFIESLAISFSVNFWWE